MAKIEEVRVDLKFSKEITKDEWMSISLGASATVSSDETFEMAIQEVQHQLRVEMRQAWGSIRRDKPQEANKHLQDEAAQVVGDEEIEEPPAPVDPLVKAAPEMGADPLPADPAWCAVHKTKMKMRSWGGYSHQVGEQWCQGHWCSEHNQPFKKFEKNGATWWSHSYEDPDTGETLWCREDGEQEEIPS